MFKVEKYNIFPIVSSSSIYLFILFIFIHKFGERNRTMKTNFGEKS